MLWRRDPWKKPFLSWVLYDKEKYPLPSPPAGRESSRVSTNAERPLGDRQGAESPLGFGSAPPAVGTPPQCPARGMLGAHQEKGWQDPSVSARAQTGLENEDMPAVA